MGVSQTVRDLRQKFGLTQVMLSAKAGVALPTLQQLEAGTSNPSVETLERLGAVLGFTIELRPRACDWHRLSAWGLPLLDDKAVESRKASLDQLVTELRFAVLEIADQPMTAEIERKRDACASMLLALAEYYPRIFAQSFGRNEEANALLREPAGKVIKLKRLAAARLAEYL